MHRFFITVLPVGQSITLPPEPARQCVQVLRMHPGEQICLFDATGREALIRLERVEPKAVIGSIETVRSPDREAKARVHLHVGLPRHEKWEWILQKGTELGAASFQPLQAQRCVARVSETEFKQKRERWQKIMIEAAEQSGRVVIPVLRSPSRITDLAIADGFWIVLHTGPDLPGLLQLISSRTSEERGNEARSPDLHLVLGPEGGLEPGEVSSLTAGGAMTASLGPRTLRCETAAITALTLSLGAAGDLG